MAKLEPGDIIIWGGNIYLGRPEQLITLIEPLTKTGRRWVAELESGVRVAPRVEEMFNADEDGELHAVTEEIDNASSKV